MKVGDKIIRQMDGFRTIGNRFWENDGTVLELTENTIKAEVYVDIPRIMVFDRKTGVNVNGADFGWIKDYKAVI